MLRACPSSSCRAETVTPACLRAAPCSHARTCAAPQRSGCLPRRRLLFCTTGVARSLPLAAASFAATRASKATSRGDSIRGRCESPLCLTCGRWQAAAVLEASAARLAWLKPAGIDWPDSGTVSAARGTRELGCSPSSKRIKSCVFWGASQIFR